jgi:hypothetical protein
LQGFVEDCSKGNDSVIRAVFLPFPDFWHLGLLWATLACSSAAYLARAKNRNALGWGLLSGATGFFLGITGFLWVGLLASRKRVSLRVKYLRLKMEEQIAHALKLPSPVRLNMEDRLLMILANNPQGLRLGALAQGMGQDWRHIEAPVRALLSQGKVRQKGDRYYFNLDE